MIVCDHPCDHFPGIPANLPSTAVCILCYTPVVQLSRFVAYGPSSSRRHTGITIEVSP